MNLLLLPGLLCDDAAWLPVVPHLRGVADCHIADYGDASSLPEMARRVHSARLADALLVEAILAMVERRTPVQFAAQIRALLERTDLTELLRSVRVPTLVACGREDAWSPVAQLETIVNLVPGSRLAIFDGCGHMAPMECPDAVAVALVEWLGAADRSADVESPRRADGLRGSAADPGRPLSTA